MRTYNKKPPIIKSGSGCYLYDESGNEYLDMIGGYGCCVAGHSNQYISGAISRQANILIQPSNIFYSDLSIELSLRLSGLFGGGKVFLTNSGTEANEAAIKLARKYFYDRGDSKKNVVLSARGSFHGRTYGSLAATGQPDRQKAFNPIPGGFIYFNFGDVVSLKEQLTEDACAVMLEPIMGEGGVIVPPEMFLKEIRDLCSKNGVLLILDEIQTGMGRLGMMFAHQKNGIKPDIMTLAKALGGGFPVGAMMAVEKIAESFDVGSHGSTFGGNTLACAASLALIDFLERDELLEKVKSMGIFFRNRLDELRKLYPDIVKEVRGDGLMLAIEFIDAITSSLAQFALERGIILNDLTPTLIRFLPPYIITRGMVDKAVGIIGDYLKLNYSGGRQ
jgi:predicted acetylornithine/succinylornithine family transaminase